MEALNLERGEGKIANSDQFVGGKQGEKNEKLMGVPQRKRGTVKRKGLSLNFSERPARRGGKKEGVGKWWGSWKKKKGGEGFLIQIP